MFEIILFIILAVYCCLILQLIIGFNKIKWFKTNKKEPLTSFSIIVPFRNEAKNISRLLGCFSNLNYPKTLFEIIMVDDFSTDQSQNIFNKWRLKNGLTQTTLLENLRLSNSPKKDAILRAVPIVKNQYIITTDADCEMHEDWLKTLDLFIQEKNSEMIVGAVIYKTKNNWFHHFQQLDLLSLQGITMGSFGIGKPFMCNGANFAYTKKLFNELGGFQGNNKMASGDDVFLLQKAAKQCPEKIHYIKNFFSIVTTKPENNLGAFFMQRVRWASKSSEYSSFYAKFLAIITLLMNFSLVVVLFFVIYGLASWMFLLVLFGIKYLVDYILLLQANSYLRKGAFFIPAFSALIYLFYVTVVGLYSIFGKFTWKGRVFRK